MTARLDMADLELLADLVVDRLAERLDLSDPRPAPGRLVTAAELAPMLGVSPATIRANAARYGGRRMGDGPRPRLRFDPAVAVAADLPKPEPAPAAQGSGRARRRRASEPSVPLLPIGGQEARP